MTAKQGFTPEEQLLKLMEKGDEDETAKFSRRSHPFRGWRRKLFLNFGSLKGLWRSLVKGISRLLTRLGNGLREPNLKALNKIFFILSVILLGYSVAGFVFGRPDIKKVYEKSRLMKWKQSEQGVISEARPFLHYLEVVRRRNIFSPVVLKEAEKPEIKKKRLQEMAKDLSLVGISWDDKEPVAMIEDKKEKKT
ncbi:MAG: hypothetical protein KKH11_06470, partial [Candidatus Omnitrophica bacterium]|nr:hypothetical protein [Candidatus Omnitrophota bacterium]